MLFAFGSVYKGLVLTRMGECPSVENDAPRSVEQNKVDCKKICTLEYNPVCASNGHQLLNYGNKCAFEVANCEANFS